MILLRNFNRQTTAIRLEQFGMPKVLKYQNLELPRGSIFHYIPTSGITELGPPQTMPMVANSDKLLQIRHQTELSEVNMLGRPRRVTAGVNKDLLQYHRMNKKLRRMRNDGMIVRDPRVVLVENYAPLSVLYRYPQTLMSWYDRYHNLMTTVVEQVIEDAKKYDRQNYLLLNVPDVLPARSALMRAEKRRDNITLKGMTDDNLLLFLELWTWLGHNRESSMFSVIPPEQLRKVNFLLQFNDKVSNINLGELDRWRKGSSVDGVVDPAQMQRRLYRTMIHVAQSEIELDETIEQDEVNYDDNEVSEDQPERRRSEFDGTDYRQHRRISLVRIVERDPNEPRVDPDIDGQDFEAEVAKFEEEEKDDIISDDDAFELVKKKEEETKPELTFDTVVSYDDGIAQACEKYIEAGTISSKEYKLVLEKAHTYKNIPNPFGDGKVIDMMKVAEFETKLEEEVLFDDPTILEKSMIKSSTKNFNKKYIENIMPKDMVASVVSVQKAGVILSDYKVDEVIDAANRLQVHTLKLAPIKGLPSTVRFTTPMVDEEGYWVANDIRTTQRKQRVDVPIRKTAPDTVALTTFYGKNFVKRSEKQVANWSGWFANQVIAAGIGDGSNKVKNLRFANVFNPDLKLPREFTVLSTRLAGMSIGDVVYNFDLKKKDTFFKPEDIQLLEKQDLLPVAKSKDAVYGMDSFSVVYKATKKGIEELGTISEILELDTSKAPKEYSELSMMGQSIPLGVIFGYYLGFENLLKEMKISYRTYEANERVPNDVGDMTFVFKDAKVSVTFDNPEQSLLLHGYRSYLKMMRDYTLHDFNKKDVYLNIIRTNKLGIRYLNELDLMEAMYVDPISERLLIQMNEPTHFKGLLKRANEMLVYDHHKPETDLSEMHLYGFQRIPGAVYTGLVRAIREYNNKPSGRRKIDIPPSEIWASITNDPAVAPASDANPIHSIKEADVVTFGGTGGRSKRSMVKRTRQFHKTDLGVLSGDTVDSGDVGITSYLAGNPQLESVDGIAKAEKDRKMEPSQLLGPSTLLSPGAMYDDDKRLNFISIQQGSAMAADGYEVPVLRTGYEKVIAHRTSSTQATVAEADGKVIDVTDVGITVEYSTKPPKQKSYPIGKHFGVHEGNTFPHELVANITKGTKFSKGDVLTYNNKFFEPDIFNPKQVNWKIGVYANTLLIEGTDTIEDSSAISSEMAEKLRTQTTEVKNIMVEFGQSVHELVKVGQSVDPDDHLCIIEDGILADNTSFSTDSIETLKRLGAHAPTAKVQGVVDRIEVFYHGDLEDMSPSVSEIVTKDNRRRKREAAASPIKIADTGKVDSSLRINGNPVELDTMIIRIYITQSVAAVGGDKAVFASQLKTTFRRVMSGRNETIDGTPIDAIFGKTSIDNRIVVSPYQIGTTVMLCELMQKKCQEILNS